MAYLNELGSYQAKVLRTAQGIVELERVIASTSDPRQQGQVEDRLAGQRAMLRFYDGMVAFLNCCLEIERNTSGSEPADHKAAPKTSNRA